MTGSPKTAKKAAAKPGVSTTVPSTSAASAVSTTTTTPAKASTEDGKVNKTTSNPEMSVVTASPGVTLQGGAAAAPPVTVVSPPTVARPSGVPPLGVREDTTHHASLFIGDLSPEVNDATLRAAFAAFPSLSECRVMYDPNTGRSRGYGFASFGEPEDARRALTTLNGEWLGSRPLRINWANQKSSHPRHRNDHHHSNHHGGGGGGGLLSHSFEHPATPLTFEQILNAAPAHNMTVYLGNLHPMTTQQDIVSLFQNISFVREVRLQAERGYGFAVLDSHEAAATAIAQLGNLAGGTGVQLHGRVLRVSWGKDRNEGVLSNIGSPLGAGSSSGGGAGGTSRGSYSGPSGQAAQLNNAAANGGLAGLPNVFGGMIYGQPAMLQAYNAAGFGLPTTFGPQGAALVAAQAQAAAAAGNGGAGASANLLPFGSLTLGTSSASGSATPAYQMMLAQQHQQANQPQQQSYGGAGQGGQASSAYNAAAYHSNGFNSVSSLPVTNEQQHA